MDTIPTSDINTNPQIPPPTSTLRPDRTWLMLCHVSALAMFLFPFGNIIGPLIIWLMKRDEDAEVNAHGAASLNFQITLTLIGFLLIVGIVLAVVGLIAAGASASSQSIPPGLRELGAALGGIFGIVAFGILLASIGLLNLIMVGVNAVRAYDGKTPTYWPAIPFFR